MYTFEDPEYVQFFLDRLQPDQEFAVIFQKQDGTQRSIVGTLDSEGNTRKTTVPVRVNDSWKSFSLERVLWIGYPDQVESLKELAS